MTKKDVEEQKRAKEIAVKAEAAAVQHFEMDQEMLEALPRAEAGDFDIPRLILVQPTSKIDGDPGDVIDSGDSEKVIEGEGIMKFVPIWFFRDFSIQEVDDKQRAGKWLRNEPKTPNNAHYSLYDNRFGTDPNGQAVQRGERLNLFVIREDQLNDPFPRVYRMVVKPSSFKEAKKFLSEWDIQIRIAQRGGSPPYTYLWQVQTKEVKNDKGKFWIYEFKKVLSDRKQVQVTQEQFAAIKYWVKTLMANKEKVTVDVGPDDEEIATPTEKPGFKKGELNF